MNLFRSCPSFFPVGALVVGALASVAAVATPAESDEIGQVIRVANRCDVYGPGFVDLGNGACGIVMSGRVSGQTRIEAGAQTAGAQGWPVSGTSNAALRNDGAGMLPGISDSRRLRIPSGADPYGR